MIEIMKYKIELVKENSSTYDITNEKIIQPKSIYEIIKDEFRIACLAEEIFGIVCLNSKNQIVGVFEVSHGTLDSSLVHPREVFKRAMLVNSACIILFHNHPSGNTEPSIEDKNMTKRIVDCGNILGIIVLDHIIASEDNYFSFKESNPYYLIHENIA